MVWRPSQADRDEVFSSTEYICGPAPLKKGSIPSRLSGAHLLCQVLEVSSARKVWAFEISGAKSAPEKWIQQRMARVIRSVGPKLVQQFRMRAEPSLFLHSAHTSSALCSRGISITSGDRVDGITVRSPPEDIPYAVKGLSHIAVAVPNLSVAAEHYHIAFGAQVSEPVEKADQGVTVVFAQLPNVCIELIHPLGEKSPVAKFLEKNPKGGIHHICLAVDDITAAADYLSSEAGVGSVGSTSPTTGAEGNPIFFLKPKDNQGVLIELQQANQSVASHQASNG